MIRKFREQSVLYKLMTIAILAFAVFFLCKCCIHLLQFPGAVGEYREAADVQLTQAFLNGDNPYRLASIEIERDIPPVLYQYSFLNSLIAAGIALLLGGRVILAHYVLALLCMTGSGVLAFRMIDRHSQQTVLPMLGGTLTLFCHWRSGYVSTTPNSLGVFLILLTAFIATSGKIRKKAAFTALLCVLLFYTKLYFVTIAAAIFIFFLCYDRREAVKFVAMCVAQGALSVLLIQLVWPLYFTYSFYFINGRLIWLPISRFLMKVGGVFAQIGFTVLPQAFQSETIDYNRLQYVLEQYGYLITVFFPLFTLLLVSLVLATVKKRRIRVSENDALGFSVIAMITQGLCLFVVGREKGAYLSYYLQLFTPFVIIASLICMERYLHLQKEVMNLALIGVVALLSLYFGYRRLPLHMMTEQEVADWKQAEAYIDAYETEEAGREDVYYSPVLAYLAMERGKNVYNNGHVGVIKESVLGRFDRDLPAHSVFPHAGEITQMHVDYQNRIKQNVRDHAYKLVTVDSDAMYVDKELLLENGYRRIDTLPLAVGNAEYEVEFYTPADQ
ncbi:MAG: hypothetical protein K6E16_00960 [Lachnospiraceae bacterium]|nr:hypothetical protein [Lachnospiraceae bacterium]